MVIMDSLAPFVLALFIVIAVHNEAYQPTDIQVHCRPAYLYRHIPADRHGSYPINNISLNFRGDGFRNRTKKHVHKSG